MHETGCSGQIHWDDAERWEYQTTGLVKKQQLEPDMKQQTVSKSGKEYVKAVYRHLAYLTCM